MAGSQSFWKVHEKGFANFGSTLDQSPWKEIPNFDPTQPLTESRLLVYLKYRLSQSVDELLTALGLSNKVIMADLNWDRCQTRLHARVTFDEADPRLEVREAAGRVRTALLSGLGTAQNGLAADVEVDYGGVQVKQCREGTALHADIQLLGYQSLIDDIAQATQALAQALGLDGIKPRSPARNQVVRLAMQAAAKNFTAVSSLLDDLLARTPLGSPAYDQLLQLRQSLQTLLDRYADRSPAAAAAEEPLPEPPPPTAPQPGGSPVVE